MRVERCFVVVVFFVAVAFVVVSVLVGIDIIVAALLVAMFFHVAMPCQNTIGLRREYDRFQQCQVEHGGWQRKLAVAKVRVHALSLCLFAVSVPGCLGEGSQFRWSGESVLDQASAA